MIRHKPEANLGPTPMSHPNQLQDSPSGTGCTDYQFPSRAACFGEGHGDPGQNSITFTIEERLELRELPSSFFCVGRGKVRKQYVPCGSHNSQHVLCRSFGVISESPCEKKIRKQNTWTH